MRKPFIAGNWKMHKTIGETIDLCAGLEDELADFDFDTCDVAVCPPFVALAAASDVLADSEIAVGAQNVHWEESGAYTGDISPLMLEGLVDYVIIGHSERRDIFGETDEWVNKKLLSALDHGLKPILCVGEHLEENEAGETEEYVGAQIRADFDGISAEQAMTITIAYEPIWAIGTGKAASGEQANDIIRDAIRAVLADLYDDEVAESIRVQYGGSVKPHNIEEFMGQPEIDGALVGGASLKAEDFAAIVTKGAETKQQ